MCNFPEKIVLSLSYLVAGFGLLTFTQAGFAQQLTFADENSLEESQPGSRMEKVDRKCDLEPTSPKCQKYLDSRYRRHTDVDRDARINPVRDIRDEKSYQEDLRKELLSYCRTEPDAPRCKKIK